MEDPKVSVCEPFISPSWGSNIVVFSSNTGKAISQELTKAYLAKACRYAGKYKIYLVPERFTILGVESLCIIDPTGKVITAQQQVFIRHDTDANNNSLNIAKTVYGEVCLLVNDDVFHPEMGKIAANKGAKIVIISQNTSMLDNINHKVISGAWNVAQSNNVCVVAVSAQFNCACAPSSLTKRNEGFIIAPTIKTLIAQLPIEKLKDLPRKHFLSRQFYFIHREDLIGEETV